MNTASPIKRRALASIDANTRSPLGASRLSPSKSDLPKSKMALGTSLIEPNTLKRPLEQEGDREAPDSAKKRRLSGAENKSSSPRNQRPVLKDVKGSQRPRSISPEDSPLFDNSTINNSQVTVISEPDVDTNAAPAPAVTENRPRQGSMTREEARRKAEILRLRLGLASYKVRTNQADVPLERLQVRPVPGGFPRRTRATTLLPPLPATSPRSIARAAMSRSTEVKGLSSPARIQRPSSQPAAIPTASLQRKESGSGSVAGADVDKSPIRREPEQTLPPTHLSTPQRGPIETKDVLSESERGGAAEGLLSLSQSSPASTLKGEAI